MTDHVLEVRDLTVELSSECGTVHAVDHVSFSIGAGMTLGLVGESGSGKSMTALSIMGLLPPNGTVVSGSVLLHGRDLTTLNDEDLRDIRGNQLSIVFQDPLTALNPALSIGWQMRESITAHREVSRKDLDREVIRGLSAVGIPDPASRTNTFPHQSSGGMQQRILLAMAMVNQPHVLIADEPTTALDVTIQAQVLALIESLVDQNRTAVLLISHNLGVIARMCDRVAVMYAGEIVEESSVDDLFEEPLHPYTNALLQSVPTGAPIGDQAIGISGAPPDLVAVPSGCRFRARCPKAEQICLEHPELVEIGTSRSVRCWIAQREKVAGAKTPEARRDSCNPQGPLEIDKTGA